VAIAYAFGAVWVIGADASLRRIDPATMRVTARIDGRRRQRPAAASSPSSCADRVWKEARPFELTFNGGNAAPIGYLG
jgi:hypothetical protein